MGHSTSMYHVPWSHRYGTFRIYVCTTYFGVIIFGTFHIYVPHTLESILSDHIIIVLHRSAHFVVLYDMLLLQLCTNTQNAIELPLSLVHSA